jgi:hypothetical protein
MIVTLRHPNGMICGINWSDVTTIFLVVDGCESYDHVSPLSNMEPSPFPLPRSHNIIKRDELLAGCRQSEGSSS